MSVHRIVVGADGSAGSQAALDWVADLATQLDAQVTAVHVFDPLAGLGEIEPPYDMQELAAIARGHLETEWTAPLASAGVRYETVFTEGQPIRALVAAADEVDADLIVVGDRGHLEKRKRFFGSTALDLPRATSRPVTVVHSHDG